MNVIEYAVPAENRTLGYQVLDWTAQYIEQPDGPDAGKPWKFTQEQAKMILVWYEIDSKGRFVWRRGVVRRMKGWGKDPMLAAIALAEACGPVRFGGWDKDGYPLGVMHPAPWIQIAAVSREQTKNTMTLFPGMISPKLKKEYALDPGKELIYVRNGVGRIEAVTSSPKSLEGGRPTLVILNESHLWLSNNEGIAMADVIRRNLGKSRDGSARSIEITNAHLPGEGSVAEKTYDPIDVAVKKGESIKGVWYDSLEAPECKDLTDYAKVTAALTVAKGDSYWVDVDRLFAEINDPATPEYVARRFYFNQVVAVDAEKWLPAGVWAATQDNSVEIPEQDRVVIGFDGSYNGDATGLIAWSIDPLKTGKPHATCIGIWERTPGPPTIPPYRTPRNEIMDKIREACAYWDVIEIAVDPALWQADLETLMDEGYPVVTFQQRGQAMIEATQRHYELCTASLMTHDDDSDFARHVGNAYVKDPSRPRLQKETGESVKHIDLAVASVMACQRAGEIAAEEQYANVFVASDYTPSPDENVPPGMRAPRQLTEADYLAPNQFQ